MPDKRFQVFISSTFKDLEEERQEVMHALLELDCMPAGMELFPAASESQWNLIKRVIDECDYYILVLGGRYGSIGPEGLSYTEMEYRYALSIKKPIISFVHRNPGKIIAEKSEATEEGKLKLGEFRALVESLLCKMWETPQELGSVVSRSLIQLIKSNPAIGWVRANEVPDRDAALELLQLRKKVEQLQRELERTRTTAPKGAEGLAQGSRLHKVRYDFKTRDNSFNREAWTSSFFSSWDDLFSAVAPLMINEATEGVMLAALNGFVEQRNLLNLLEGDRFKGLTLSNFSVNPEDFQTLKIQFRALGLIAKSEKARSVKDLDTYWTLTPYGDEVMTRLRAIRVEQEDPEAGNEVGVAELI